jgi:ethanolamine utilization protein EutQ (cupin superfamily)
MAQMQNVLIEKLNFDSPEETRQFAGHGRLDLVTTQGGPIGRGTFEPGWRWSNDVKPLAGTDSCETHHLGYVLSGSMTVRTDDGTEVTYEAGDVMNLAPGHDAWVDGPDNCVIIDWTGASTYAKKQ